MAVWSHLMSIAGLPNWNTSHCDRLCEIGKHRVVIQTDRCSIISWRGGLWFTPFTTPASKLLKANGSINNTAQEQHNNLSRQLKTCCCSQRRCPWNSSGAGLVLHAKSITWQWAHFAFSHWSHTHPVCHRCARWPAQLCGSACEWCQFWSCCPAAFAEPSGASSYPERRGDDKTQMTREARGSHGRSVSCLLHAKQIHFGMKTGAVTCNSRVKAPARKGQQRG